jgi:hypothetical protein
MKIVFTLLLLVPFIVCQAQNYESNKQKYLKKSATEFIPINTHKIISISGDSLIAELPTGESFNGTMKFSGNQTSHGKTGKKFDLGDNDLMVVYEDEIFLNLTRHKGIAITYYLTNYKEPNAEQQKQNKQEDDEAEYKMNLKLYGKFTADCIKERKVKVGMNYMGVFDILGQPLKRNTTQTENSIKQQFVYDNMYIYTEFDKVTAIQTIEK